MQYVKLIIAGPRYVTDYSLIKPAIDETGLLEQHLNGEITLDIVSGMAKGVDSLAVRFAKEYNLVLHEFHADWDKHKKSAGIIRNTEMGNFATHLLAIWDSESRGTGHMIGYARKKGLKVFVHRIPKPDLSEKPSVKYKGIINIVKEEE